MLIGWIRWTIVSTSSYSKFSIVLVCMKLWSNRTLWSYVGEDYIIQMLIQLRTRVDECIANMNQTQEMKINDEDNMFAMLHAVIFVWIFAIRRISSVSYHDHRRRTIYGRRMINSISIISVKDIWKEYTLLTDMLVI